jgi:twinkle protein
MSEPFSQSSGKLSRADLEIFDPHPRKAGTEHRFLCPYCGGDKPRDAAHRCLCVNAQTGLWNCQRCGEKGRLLEFWPERTSSSPGEARKQARFALSRAFELPATLSTPKIAQKPLEAQKPQDVPPKWETILAASRPVAETAGEAYLQQRGIPVAVATLAGALFSRAWHRRDTVVFPFKNMKGEVVALAGRCLHSGGIDKPAAGPRKEGAFFAPVAQFTPLAEAVPAIVICEAPLDALSLAAVGFPALAVGGTSAPVWLTRACAFRRVALAFDADSAGDAAAAKIGNRLSSFGAECERLRPSGFKDWNAYLQAGRERELEDYLVRMLLL